MITFSCSQSPAAHPFQNKSSECSGSGRKKTGELEHGQVRFIYKHIKQETVTKVLNKKITASN